MIVHLMFVIFPEAINSCNFYGWSSIIAVWTDDTDAMFAQVFLLLMNTGTGIVLPLFEHGLAFRQFYRTYSVLCY
jgi:hypothetical protein